MEVVLCLPSTINYPCHAYWNNQMAILRYHSFFVKLSLQLRPNPSLEEWTILLLLKAFYVRVHFIWPAQKHGYSWALFTALLNLVITVLYLFQVFIVSHIQ
jgi:hypothetical protein